MTARPSRLALLVAIAGTFACSERAQPPAQRSTVTPHPADSSPSPRPAERDSTWVDVRGPTLIAFYPANAAAVIDSAGDAATALDDFGYHLASAQDSLRALGVRVVSVPSRTLHVVTGGRVTVFNIPRDSVDLGFYLVAPGREPVVYYGAQTDADLIDFARAYLRPAP